MNKLVMGSIVHKQVVDKTITRQAQVTWCNRNAMRYYRAERIYFFFNQIHFIIIIILGDCFITNKFKPPGIDRFHLIL